MKNQDKPGEKGFSLIEVVAAMAVLAFAVTALLKLSSGGLRLSKAAEDKTALVAAAESMLSALRAGGSEEPFMEAGEIECHGELILFRQDQSGKLVKIVVTATNRATGARFTLTSLRQE